MTLLSPPQPSARDFLMGLNKQILKPLSLYKARKEYTRDRARDYTQLVQIGELVREVRTMGNRRAISSGPC